MSAHTHFNTLVYIYFKTKCVTANIKLLFGIPM